MFTRSEVIVLTNKHTNKRMQLKTRTYQVLKVMDSNVKVKEDVLKWFGCIIGDFAAIFVKIRSQVKGQGHDQAGWSEKVKAFTTSRSIRLR